jgi:AcrR family transcriptional regulator
MPLPRSTPARKPRRVLPAADRRQAIIDASLDVFAEKGFAQARLEDVAARAGIAKGTIYLYFADKQDLFKNLVSLAATPIIERLAAISDLDMPIATALDRLFQLFRTEVLGTRRKEIMRLVLTEGARFPEIAQLYHAQVISRGLPLMRAMLERAADRGELASDAAARFPHLVVAPLLVGLLWDGLFSTFEPLDVEGLLAAHRDLLLGHSAGDQS